MTTGAALRPQPAQPILVPALLAIMPGAPAASVEQGRAAALEDEDRRDERHAEALAAAATQGAQSASETATRREEATEASRSVADHATRAAQQRRTDFRQALSDARQSDSRAETASRAAGTEHPSSSGEKAGGDSGATKSANPRVPAPQGAHGQTAEAPAAARAEGFGLPPGAATSQSAHAGSAEPGAARSAPTPPPPPPLPPAAQPAAAPLATPQTAPASAEAAQPVSPAGQAVGAPRGAGPPPSVGAVGAIPAQFNRPAGASAQRSPAAPSGADGAEMRENIERMVRVLRNRIDGERSHTVLRLDPPQLGKVRLELDLRRDALVLRIETETDLAHRLLRSELGALRQALDAAGIHLERVEAPPPSSNGGSLFEHAGGGQGEHGSASPDAGSSEAGGDGATDSALVNAAEAPDTEPARAAESLVNVLA